MCKYTTAMSYDGKDFVSYVCMYVWTRAGSGLNTAGLGRARALHFGLRLFIGLGAYAVKLGWDFYQMITKISPAGLSQNPGTVRLRHLGYLVKSQARRSGSSLDPTQP
jgi:hypothetical protein